MCSTGPIVQTYEEKPNPANFNVRSSPQHALPRSFSRSNNSSIESLAPRRVPPSSGKMTLPKYLSGKGLVLLMSVDDNRLPATSTSDLE